MNSLLGGDFRFFWPENMANLVHLPYAWDSILNTGLGTSDIGTLWINSYLFLTASLSYFGIPWNVISFIFWLLPVFLFSFIFGFFLFFHLFPEKKWFSLLAGLIYSTNTYILMVALGGQLGVALAYSFVPLVVWAFIRVFEKTTLRNSLIAGLILGSQMLLDPRLVYLTLIGIFGFWIFVMPLFRFKKTLLQFVVPIVIAFFLHAFWILPLVLFGDSSIAHNVGTTSAFIYFSFADFSHSLSLLQPNWPENIFGLVHFMRPEFVLIPVLAYSSLLFINSSKSKIQSTREMNASKNDSTQVRMKGSRQARTILYFCLLGLFAAFFAKGATDPFAGINIWVFNNMPGMQLFRDPTKWYLLISLSYSVLIPFSVWNIVEWLKAHNKFSIFNFQFLINSKVFNFQNIFLAIIVLFLIYLISPIFFQSGARPKHIPDEYIQLKNFLISQNSFSRTLWIPQFQRFGYFSNEHPAVRLEELYAAKKDGSIQHWLQSPKLENKLQVAGIRYIIIPYDPEGEIFQSDRKYDVKKYLSTFRVLQSIKWLKQTQRFGKIVVYQVPNAKDHFFTLNSQVQVSYHSINPTKYLVSLKNAKKGERLVFSESFDKNWTMLGSSYSVSSIKYDNFLNSFVLPKDGNYMVEVSYSPQKWVDIGLGISLATFILVIGGLIFLRRR